MVRVGLVAVALLALVGCDKDTKSAAPSRSPDPKPAATRPKVPGPLQWRSDFGGAMAQGKATDTLVFVEFSAQWCAPCKEIEKKVFTVDRVRAALSAFVLVKVDLTDDDEAAVAIADKYEANTLPHLLVLDAGSGKVLGRIGSMTTADELLAVLSAARL